MKAGRELDALVAIAVFGAKHSGTSAAEWMHFPTTGPYADCDCEGHMEAQVCPRYSTNIADAWEVVEKLGRWHGFDFMIVMPDPEQTFHLRTYEAGWYEATNDGPERRVVSDADTAPLAICLAALKAKEVTHE